jgi:hypothetical protein
MRTIKVVTAELATANQLLKTIKAQQTSASKRVLDLKIELTEIMRSTNVDQLKNDHGTFYFSTRKVPNIVDYERFAAFIYSHHRLDLLQMRPSKGALAEPVPGVEARQIQTLNVRGG